MGQTEVLKIILNTEMKNRKFTIDELNEMLNDVLHYNIDPVTLRKNVKRLVKNGILVEFAKHKFQRGKKYKLNKTEARKLMERIV